MLALTMISPILLSEFIYDRAPFPSCHASTIVETHRGELLAAWFGGTNEGNPDVAIYLSRHTKQGWTAPEKIAGYGNVACYNPVLFQPKKGPLLLFYKVGTEPQKWWGMLTRSTNNGKTWDTPTRLPDGILGPIKNKPIQLPDSTILCGSSEEAGGWRVHFERTKDFGVSWWRTPALNDPKAVGAIQPSILPLDGKRLKAIGRTQQGKLFAIDSENEGESWGPMRLLDVPNPNSGTDAVRLSDGRFLLVFNDTPKGRTPLNVALSTDGEHWKTVVTLESEPGEYSYPAVVQTKDGLVHITYTWHRRRIRHVVLDPRLLTENG